MIRSVKNTRDPYILLTAIKNARNRRDVVVNWRIPVIKITSGLRKRMAGTRKSLPKRTTNLLGFQSNNPAHIRPAQQTQDLITLTPQTKSAHPRTKFQTSTHEPQPPAPPRHQTPLRLQCSDDDAKRPARANRSHQRYIVKDNPPQT
jgi:hypothetical protein